jgi:chromosome segregation ATPase
MPRGITEDDVFAAADALLIRGERPTIERVRQTLGRGSPNTVNRLLDTWWTRLASRMNDRSAEGLPTSVVELCRRLYGELTQQAQAAAEGTLKTAEHELAQAREQLDQDRARLATERLGMQAAAENLRQELAVLNEAHRTLIKQAAELESTLAAERSAVAQERAASEKVLADRDRRISALEKEIERVRGQWQGNETRWLKEIDHLRTELKRNQTEHDKQVRSHERRVTELESRLAKAADERQDLLKHQRQLELTVTRERDARLSAEVKAAGVPRQRIRRTRAAAARVKKVK